MNTVPLVDDARRTLDAPTLVSDIYREPTAPCANTGFRDLSCEDIDPGIIWSAAIWLRAWKEIATSSVLIYLTDRAIILP